MEILHFQGFTCTFLRRKKLFQSKERVKQKIFCRDEKPHKVLKLYNEFIEETRKGTHGKTEEFGIKYIC